MKKNNYPDIIPLVFNCSDDTVEMDMRTLISAGARMFHFDVMDGEFTRNNFDGLNKLRNVGDMLKKNNCISDIHLVVASPKNYFRELQELKPDRVCMHAECGMDTNEFASFCKSEKISPGLALNLKTEVNGNMFKDFDYVHLICNDENNGIVHFQNEAYEKIKTIKEMTGDSMTLTLDCGVKEEHIVPGVLAGADFLVMGSAIFKSPDIAQTFLKYRNMIPYMNSL